MSADTAPVPVLDDRHWAVRTEVYRSFADEARAPTHPELARATGLETDEVADALAALEAHHHLTLLPDRSGVWMAHPFSAVPTAFPVATPRGRYFANCVWNAVGIPALLGTDGTTHTRCAGSGQPLSFGVRDGRRFGDNALVHFAVPPRDAWKDIGFT